MVIYMENPNNPVLSLGLGMALAQNYDAMTRFAALPNESKQEIIRQTHFYNRNQKQATKPPKT